ncbi:unnamed protein product, partial [Tenebrio molitor]
LEKYNSHTSFSKMLILVQTFGFFPVQGISGPDFRSLNFTWKSVRVVYAVLTILGSTFITVMQLYKIVGKGLDLREAFRFSINFSGLISGCLFLNLAKNWPVLMKNWSTVDLSMLNYGWPAVLNRKLNILVAVFMGAALIEYILGQTDKLVLSLECNNTTADAITYFFRNMSYSHIFMLMDYDIVKGLILEGINLQLTFIWTYNDLFIMFLSTALAYRFRQITTKIQSVSDAKVGNEITWKKLREDYDKLCRFCKALDEQISYIVLLAFASDLFFILVQLCSSLKRMRNNWERFYFYWSFGLLILRTVCLCLIGAKVNDESIKPLPILNSVPSDIYNIEIQRLIQQIASTPVAITGKNIFSITKGLILSIAGAIVTYELVLVQFNGNALNDLMEANRFFFNFSGVIAGCLFLNLARNWPVLMKDWGTVELSMLSYGWPAGLNRKLNILLVVFVTMALILSLECNNSTADAFTYFFGNMSYSHIFTLLDYDIQRFIQQIGTSEVAITGKNFFSITRGLILSIAGAIVTYELVLIQFNDSLLTSTPEDTGSCPVYV